MVKRNATACRSLLNGVVLAFMAVAMVLTTFAPASILVGTDASPGTVFQYSDTGQALGEYLVPGSWSLSRPDGAVFMPNGDLLVSSYGAHEVLRFAGPNSTSQPPGTYLSTFVSAGSGGLGWCHDMAYGPDGNLYVASTDNILRYNGATGAFIDVFAEGHGLIQPVNIQFRNGLLYVPNWGGNDLLRFDETTGAFVDEFITAGSGGLSGPGGLFFRGDGTILLGSSWTDSVLKYDATTGAFLGTFIPSGTVGLHFPEDILQLGDKLLVAGRLSNRILSFSQDGQLLGKFADATAPDFLMQTAFIKPELSLPLSLAAYE
jgi:hypothetical protein